MVHTSIYELVVPLEWSVSLLWYRHSGVARQLMRRSTKFVLGDLSGSRESRPVRRGTLWGWRSPWRPFALACMPMRPWLWLSLASTRRSLKTLIQPRLASKPCRGPGSVKGRDALEFVVIFCASQMVSHQTSVHWNSWQADHDRSLPVGSELARSNVECRT